MLDIRLIHKNEKGMVLPLGLMFLAIIAILGTTAVVITTTDLKIGSNYRASEQAFYVAEAGISEALYRLGLFDDSNATTPPQAPPSGSMISINGLTDNNAAISIDPNGLLSNNLDDDGNLAVDDISDLNYNGAYDNRTWQTKILLKTSDDADTTTTVYTPTIQPSASWLEYSSSTADGTELIIEYKKDSLDIDGDGNTSEIVFYDGSLANPYNVETAATSATGQPVVVITSTGRSQGSTRVIQVEAVHQPVDIQAESAIMVDLSPTLSGSVLVSGFNYDGSTKESDCSPCNAANWDSLPGTFDTNGVDNHGGAEKFLPLYNGVDQDINLLAGTSPAPANEEELGTEQDIPYGTKLESSGHKPGVWTTQTVSPSADVFGGNDTEPWKKDSAGAWKPLTDLLGITQDQLDAILANANVTESDMDSGSGHLKVAPQGIMYIDNAASGQALKITAATPSNTDGWGLMYVTGDFESQKLAFRGLIYVEGDTQIAASFWMMGCMAVKGTTSGDFSAGNATFLYSKDALERYVNKGMKFVILSWQEVLN
ncbi:MAG: pilus assembly PilX N-terminal domain-containing protein [Desulfobacteraceae bacterium]|nr:pilus assembly PilX N-terminal domain-containing protein [Desulfobacteraceae bacterium]